MQTLVDNLYKDIEERKRGAERADTEKAELRFVVWFSVIEFGLLV